MLLLDLPKQLSSVADRMCRFYYADERNADGSVAGSKIDGEAHADLFVELAKAKSQGPWSQTFVKGVGYKAFPPTASSA